MEIKLPDGTPLEEVFDEFDKLKQKRNLRNWLNKKFPKVWFGYNASYLITHPWEILRVLKREIKWAWQRVFREWDDRAVWGIDFYIADQLSQLTKQLIKKHQGIPISMFDGLEHLENDENGIFNEEAMQIAENKWVGILNEISEGFRLYGELNYKHEDSESRKKFETAFNLFSKYFENLGY